MCVKGGVQFLGYISWGMRGQCRWEKGLGLGEVEPKRKKVKNIQQKTEFFSFYLIKKIVRRKLTRKKMN